MTLNPFYEVRIGIPDKDGPFIFEQYLSEFKNRGWGDGRIWWLT